MKADTIEEINGCLNCTKEKCDNCLNDYAKRVGKRGRNIIDLAGQRFGSWTVIKLGKTPPNRKGAYWLCLCDCGTEAVVNGSALRRGKSTGCNWCRGLRKKKGAEINGAY